MAYNAGSAFLSIVPSFRGFVEACDEQAGQAAEVAGKTFAKVWADTVRSGTNGANIGPSEEALARQGEEDASRYSEAFQARLDAAHPTVKVNTDTKTADTAMSGLVATAAALAPAVAGAVGPFAAGLAAVGVSGYAAAAGVGAFVLAAEPGLKAAEAPAKQLVTTWQQANAAFTDPVIAKGLGLVTPALNLLTPSVRATAGALDQLEPKVQSALASPYWRQFSTYAAGEGATAIGSFSTAFGGLAHLFSGVAEGMAPEIARIDSDMSKWGADLTKWGNEAAGGGMQGFLAWVQQNGPLAAKAFEQIGQDAIVLARAGAPLSGIWLNVLNVVARLVGDLESLNPKLTTWAAGAASVAFAANKLTQPWGGLSGVIGTVAGALTKSSDGSTSAKRSLGELAGAAVLAQPELAALGLAVGAVASSALWLDSGTKAAAKAASTWAAGFEQSTATLGSVSAQISAYNQQLDVMTSKQAALKSLGDQLSHVESAGNVGNAISSFGELGNQIQQLAAKYGVIIKPTDDLDQAIKDVNQATRQNGDAMGDLRSKLGILKSEQDAQVQAQIKAAQAAGLSTTAAKQLVSAENQLSQAMSQANTDAQGLDNVLNILSGNAVSMAQTQQSVDSAFQSLTSSIKQNGKALFDNTTKADANQAAVAAVVSAIDQHVEVMAKQGSSIKSIDAYLNGNAAQLAAVWRAAGLTTGQIEQLLRQYGLTPKQISTTVHAPGLTALIGDAATARNAVNSIPSSKSTTVKTFGIQAATQGIGAVIGQLAALPSQKNVLINIVTKGGGVAAGIGAAIGHNAQGTSDWRGGLTWAGENGPELELIDQKIAAILGWGGPQIVDVPAGAQIIPAAQTARILAQPKIDFATPKAIASLPAPASVSAGPAGPAVAIGQATFTEAADLDLLMRRAALAQKARQV